ncbi:MAG TPA: SUF system Fe-S cluster assembly protein [Ignavibacteria bacterium]|nr:SUF system Fe-S cluster assembly protein [Ignavibacteria bacterium]
MTDNTEEKNTDQEITERELNGESILQEQGEKVSSVNADAGELNNAVVEALKSVYDPEIPVNIYELGLIYSVNINEGGKVVIEMTLTSPACPVAGTLPPEVEGKVRSIPGVTECVVKVVWDPPWGMHMMSEEAKLQLNLY